MGQVSIYEQTGIGALYTAFFFAPASKQIATVRSFTPLGLEPQKTYLEHALWGDASEMEDEQNIAR